MGRTKVTLAHVLVYLFSFDVSIGLAGVGAAFRSWIMYSLATLERTAFV